MRGGGYVQRPVHTCRACVHGEALAMLHLVALALELRPALGDALGGLRYALVRPAMQKGRLILLGSPLCTATITPTGRQQQLQQHAQRRLGVKSAHGPVHTVGAPPRLPHDRCIERTQVLRIS